MVCRCHAGALPGDQRLPRADFRRFRARGTVNLSSGLPNLVALRAGGPQRDHALIVARIINYPQLAAAVAGDSERALVDQIVQRLTVGAQDHVIFQGDEGIFAWLTEPGTAIGHHVEALHSLFRSPARIEGDTYDLNVTFGVEIGSGRSISQRLNSALVAADEAASEGLKWKYHDPERMKDASWRLSLLSQLDHAIDNGEVWIAFQPQLDLRTGRIRGAEALARWTHPEKGPIGPQEFVTAAEQGGRIEKLTMFVLEQSVAAAARFNREGAPFDVAVNLSARMLTMKSLPMEVRAALARHGLDPARLTLELTETAALASDGSDMAPLFKLRDLGVACRSTIMAPACRRSIISRRSRRARSRSTRASSRRCATTAATSSWSSRPSPSRIRSIARSSPKASKPRNCSTCCARSAATPRKVSSSAVRPARRACCAGCRTIGGPAPPNSESFANHID